MKKKKCIHLQCTDIVSFEKITTFKQHQLAVSIQQVYLRLGNKTERRSDEKGEPRQTLFHDKHTTAIIAYDFTGTNA